MWRCISCGAPVEAEDKFCTVCGTDIESIQRSYRPSLSAEECWNCGAETEAHETFCWNCSAHQDPDPETRRCWHCEAELHPRASRCHDCGEEQAPRDRSRREEEYFCPTCGNVIGEFDNFCTLCGAEQ